MEFSWYFRRIRLELESIGLVIGYVEESHRQSHSPAVEIDIEALDAAEAMWLQDWSLVSTGGCSGALSHHLGSHRSVGGKG